MDLSPAFHMHFAPSTHTISAEGCAGQNQNTISPAFRALDTPDLRRGSRAINPKRNLTCISRPRRARSPQRVACAKSKTRSRPHFAPSTRTISPGGCAGQVQNAISPAFRALDTNDLRRGLCGTNPKRNLTCISRPRHPRSPQRVALDRVKTYSHLHFARSTCTIPAEGCAGKKSSLTCISRPRRARSPQRLAFRGAPAAPPQP